MGREGGEGGASKAWREAVQRARDEERGDDPASGEGASEGLEVHVEEVREEAEDAVERGRGPGGGAPGVGTADGRAPELEELDEDTREELARVVGPSRAPRLEARLADAGRAFDRERYQDARRILAKLLEQAPGSPTVRELYGLTLYRMGRWRDAARQLEAFRELTGSTEQHPVLADCYRALGRYAAVEDLWRELGASSPGAELVTEGRIVAAGSLADQDDLAGAIERLGKGWRLPKAPRTHHLRRAYALADLYERAGELPAARDLFARVDDAAPGLTDAGRRARALGGSARR